ncbi:MAG: putative Acetoacetyl-CoA reductase [Gammaproteobacteria bacterium]|jgi:NAD(P)-dependent dehydrogenase (short-subunit alcohol dehydrogenase family)|nr:putative Acetoacetyl-CoA reductase [Gammaproteobacteria bacterium]
MLGEEIKRRETVVVIGGNRGIGLGFVKNYLSKGCSVIATYRDPEKLEELKKIKEIFPDALDFYQLDIKNEAAISSFSEKIKQPIDILILNAGILLSISGSHPSIDKSQEMRDTMDVNVYGPDNIIRALFPQLLNPHACAVYVSSSLSNADENLGGRHHAYRVSKAAGNMIMQNWNIELAATWLAEGHSYQIRPCAFPISPGWVQTDMGGPRASLTVEESVSGMASVIAAVREHKQASLYFYNGSVLQKYPEPLVVTKKKEEDKDIVSAQRLVLSTFHDSLETHPVDDREWSPE